MKVETNLKAGGLLEDTSRAADRAIGEATAFVYAANHEARALTNNLKKTTASVWNFITHPLS